jgi:predicted nuclease of predicted toxin-antitoxin system
VKFYADENIDIALVRYLRHDHSANIQSAVELGLSGRDDSFHFQEARRRNRFLLTHDKDFLNHSLFPFQGLTGVVILDTPSVGYSAYWLYEHILPSGKNIVGTKIVIHAHTIDVHWRDETGSMKKQTLGGSAT